eukprot:tig00001178_g7384.t1
MGEPGEPGEPGPSRRVQETELPAIEQVLDRYGSLPGIISMAQGFAFWGPPPSALAAAASCPSEPSTHRYGAVLGLPELREAIARRMEERSGVVGKEVMVTAGANQAFVNAVLALCDPGDEAILLAPYYFNHMMALQLANVAPRVLPFRPEDLQPDLEALPALFSPRTRALVLVTPGNPSGACLPPATVRALEEECRRRRVWLVSDEVYEDFVHDGAVHCPPRGDHVVHIGSFSKSYGMAGWRVGWIAYPPRLSIHMQKIQDTIPTCATVAAQRAALACLREDPAWLAARLADVRANREAVWAAVEPAGTVRTAGAIYFLVPLPRGLDEATAVARLAEDHGVLVTPGSAFGAPGHVRVTYGNQGRERCAEAARRLAAGLAALAEIVPHA